MEHWQKFILGLHPRRFRQVEEHIENEILKLQSELQSEVDNIKLAILLDELRDIFLFIRQNSKRESAYVFDGQMNLVPAAEVCAEELDVDETPELDVFLQAFPVGSG